MKILLLCWRDTGHPEGGGSERYLERVAAYLADQGHQVVFRTAAYEGAPAHSRRHGVTFSRGGGNFSVYPRAWAAMLAARVGLGPIARALGGAPEVVVDTQNGVPFFARIFAGAPTVVLTHHCHRAQWPVAGPMVGRLGWFIESTLSPLIHRRCRYITVSSPSAEDLLELGIARERITIIRNGVDPIPAAAADTRPQATSPDSSPLHLVTLSRLVPHKQIEHAIDALAALGPDHSEVVLDIIGSGWWHDELVAHTHARGVADRVRFHGQVTEAEKHRILSDAAIHLMPSRKEGWGLAVIEAAQHGVPTIGYNSSAGLRDSVIDGVTGTLVDSEHQFHTAVSELLEDAATRQQMATACIARAAEFSWDKTATAVAEVLRHPRPQAR